MARRPQEPSTRLVWRAACGRRCCSGRWASGLATWRHDRFGTRPSCRARALERAHAAIAAELHSLLGHQDGRSDRYFAEYRSDALKAGAWTDMQLYANCRRDEANCARCPRAAAAIAQHDAFNVLCGAHFFSRLTPGTHIGSHCGPSNLRLRVHLGLVVPPGTRIRVGDEVREWREGECLVFDDSFEHEVWHDGDAGDRIVLICDMWHPGLDVDREIVPALSKEEMQALAAARKGQHLPINTRYYTVGGSVDRSKQ